MLNSLDNLIIDNVKNFVFEHAPNLSIGGGHLTVMLAPVVGLLFLGEVALIIFKSDRMQKRIEKSPRKELIANLLTLAGIGVMVVILL